jgi:Zn-dependent protease with chaperone function
MTISILVLIAAWFLFLELSALALLYNMSESAHSEITSALLRRCGLPEKGWRSVRFFIGDNAGAYASATTCFWQRVVTIDALAFTLFPPQELEWLLAHEFAHLKLNHPRLRFYMVALGFKWIFPRWFARVVARQEKEADTFAYHVTGYVPRYHIVDVVEDGVVFKGRE